MHRVENLVNESCDPGNRRLKCRDMGTGSQLRMLTTDLAPPIIGLVNGESHPGSKKPGGSFVGRSAPEIDVFEATIGGPGTAHIGQVSQTARRAVGGAFPSTQASEVPLMLIRRRARLDQNCYQLKGQCFSTYGFEYKPGYADPLSLLLHKLMDAKYISWITDDKLLWTMNSNMVGADTATEIGARHVPVEPMTFYTNIRHGRPVARPVPSEVSGSLNFGFIDFDHLTFPAVMRVDWVRIYQDPDNVQVGCNPADYPTADYINQYMEAYTNANLTTWVGFPPGYTQE
ncbi:beta-glucan synthesis-associated protein-domain-containing protein [Mycena olivaceomarginata]|nr:beta-glucan synthesis-associated protein-domain-containing protein [Mycena olivaceomarginata]